MWIIFHKADFEIVGVSADCEQDSEKKDVITEIVNGLVKPGKISEYGAIQETDKEKVERYIEAFPDKLVMAGTKSKPRLSIRDIETYFLFIKIDAPDKHPVDGVPEIPADGKSSALITLQKIDDLHKVKSGKNDNEKIFFRTNHGILRDDKGKSDINSISLSKGKAAVRLFSETVKRVATVQIFSAESNLKDSVIQVEFI